LNIPIVVLLLAALNIPIVVLLLARWRMLR
jgi:hypothetical protein